METSEQQAVIEAPLDVDLTLVSAFAGSGKTRTLEKVAARHSDLRILYLVFNASLAAEAVQKFPSNVTCSTVHKLAYGRFGGRYYKKLLPNDLRVTDAMRVLGLEDDYGTGRDVVDCLRGYCVSDLVEFPESAIAPDRVIEGEPAYLKHVAVLARRLWSKMCDPKSMEVGMVHDAYLKLFHLSRPQLGYDLILLDEGQDSSPVTLAIVRAQQCPVYIVGDTHQSIYQFRGAVDAMMMPADRKFSLTHSFRFGPRVAEIATSILAHCKGETKRVVGAGYNTYVGDFDGPRTVLCRTNAGVFRRAVQAIERGQSVSFIGGSEGYQFARMRDAYFLRCEENDRVQDPFLRTFRSWGQLEKFAEDAADPDAKAMVRTVNEYGARLPDLIDGIQRLEQPFAAGHSQICVTTAHKGKGLTIPAVQLDNDFVDLVNAEGRLDLTQFTPQEANLLYVAITRVSEKLAPNSQLRSFRGAVA